MRPARLDRAGDVPLFRQIADALRDEIASGALSPGQRLPSEADLIAHYQVARMTVRQAIADLRAEGLVVAEHGRGVFVRATAPPRRLTTHDPAWPSDAAANLLAVTDATADSSERTRLGLRAAAKVVRVDHWFSDDTGPLAVTTLVARKPVAQAARLRKTTAGTPQEVLDRLAAVTGPLTDGEHEVTARMPTSTERSLLLLDTGTPVLATTRTLHGPDGAPAVLVRGTYPAHRYVLTGP